MKKLILFLICLLVGCDEMHEKNTPPKFSKGDVVKASLEDDNLGIIIKVDNCSSYGSKWHYTVMFQDTNMEYKEADIVLHQRAIWHKKENVVPEIEKMENIP